jgi:uncharacterized protein with HEPN domain
MSKDDLLYREHMLDTARRIVAKVQGFDRSAYDADENLRLALVHLVQMLGEAARRVAPETQVRYPFIPWREIIGMRHKLVHDYLNVDEDIVWTVVTQDIPPLVSLLEAVVVPGEEHML